MLKTLLKRLISILFLLLAVFLAAKGLVRSLPGDPVDVILAETGTTIDPVVLRHELGLDRGYWESSFSQLHDLVIRFDWGLSISRKSAIGPLLLERAKSSAVLAAVALLGALLFSFAFSFAAATPHRGREVARNLLRGLSTTAVALPTAWIGPILALLLAVHWRLFALTGGIALPALTLGLGLTGFWLRAISETLDDRMRADAARTARAKGLSEWKVAWKHAFLPASGPLVAYLGSQAGAIFAGTVIVETIFDRPGLGSLLVEAIFKRDYPLVESVLILTSALILFGNLAGDALQVAIEPRLREGDGA